MSHKEMAIRAAIIYGLFVVAPLVNAYVRHSFDSGAVLYGVVVTMLLTFILWGRWFKLDMQ